MRAFYGSRLSENITGTDEGYLIAHRVPIARTGWQDYRGREIDRKGELGLDPNKLYKVLREPEDVFSPHTLASAEGKSVTLLHPPEDLNAQNEHRFNKGHAQHIERGPAAESGQEHMLADLIIKGADAVSAVQNGTREISCGYDCKYERIGTTDTFKQTHIRMNHIAIVPTGRAGPHVRIRDQHHETQETPRVKTSKDLITLGLAEYAKTATPAELIRASQIAVRDADPDDDDEEKKKKKDEEKVEDKAKDKAMDAVNDRLDKLTSALDALVKAKAKDEKEDEEEDKEKKKDKTEDKAKDEGTIVLSEEEKGKNPVADQNPALALHMKLKPIVAQSRDAAAIKAWEQGYQVLTGTKGNNDGYGRMLDTKKPDGVTAAEQMQGTNDAAAKADASYKSAFRK